MTDEEFRALLTRALDLYDEENPGEIRRVASYREEGMMTLDEGVVAFMTDGTEFAVRILRHR